MLKIHRSDPQLIVQLRFCGRQPCGRFLRAYREGALRAALEGRLAALLTLYSVPLQLELRAGAERLDALLADEERCLSCIFAQKPDRLRDEELTELEDALRNLTFGSGGQGGNVEVAPAPMQSLAPSSSEKPPPPPPPPSGQTFMFQGQPIGEAPLERQRQGHLEMAGREWKGIGVPPPPAHSASPSRPPPPCSEPANKPAGPADVCALSGPQMAQGWTLPAAWLSRTEGPSAGLPGL
uniref:TNFRSF1A associated via death domain n=1 Tax=Myotis myotis TaxID=51298 RepID=A0A7J7SDR3_MYOMY|nr:TNFRSF1A associated via death domain [Myotis myotis]